MKFEIEEHSSGIEVKDSFQTFWDKETINFLYEGWHWKRSKFSMYLEWFIHTLCYELGYQKSRGKDVFFEWDRSWFKNLFKK